MARKCGRVFLMEQVMGLQVPVPGFRSEPTDRAWTQGWNKCAEEVLELLLAYCSEAPESQSVILPTEVASN
jgi:hypothetical protein